MALYIDSSALLKRYIEEPDSAAVVEIDELTCEIAADVSEATGARSLDALHLGALSRVDRSLPLLTFDIRQAQAARALGLTVIGA